MNSYHVVFYCPDKNLSFNGHTADERGVGGGETTLIRLAKALVDCGHAVTVYANCDRTGNYSGVRYKRADELERSVCDVLIAITLSGEMDLSVVDTLPIQVRLRIVSVAGKPKVKGLERIFYDFIYVPSNFLRDHVINEWGIDPRKVFVCGRGVVDEHFANRSGAADRDPFTIVYPHHPSKGLSEAIALMRELRKHDPRFTLDVYGGYELWGGRPQEIPQEPGVRFKGLIGQKELAQRLFSYGFCLCLQELEEGFGMAAWQAKRAGVIVVASHVGAYPEIIRDGHDGFLIGEPFRSPGSLQRAQELILSLVQQPAYADFIRQNAMKSPRSWGQIAQAMRAHWDTALQQRSEERQNHLLLQLEERRLVVQKLGKQLAQAQAHVQQLQGRLHEKERRIRHVEAELKRALSKVVHLNTALHAIYNRRIWPWANRVANTYFALKHFFEFKWLYANAYKVARRALPPGLKRWVQKRLFRPELPAQTSLELSPLSGSVSTVEQPKLARTCVYDVVVLPIIEWGFRFQRPQQLARQFARGGHRVFYAKTTLEVRSQADATVAPIEDHVVEIALRGAIPLNVYQERMDAQTLERCVEAMDRLRREHGMSEAICLVQLPFWRPLARALRERFGWKTIYDCMDHHAGFSTNKPLMLEEEAALSRDSDLVLVTAARLREAQMQHNANCLLVPNAGDYEHFNLASAPASIPQALQALPKPRIGYYGAISDWFDAGLVAKAARLRPEWSFVLIGSTAGADLRPLRKLRNVHLLGEQPYATLPAYLRGFDVCIIPFKLTPLTEATDPVKFYEYLSAGKPVVSTPLPELAAHEKDGLVRFADEPASFVEAVERSLCEDAPRPIAARQAFARQNSWGARFKQLHEAVGALYARASLVVVTYNNLSLNRQCLGSIFNNTLWPNLEVIVVDNASQDGTREYLKELAKERANVKLILNERNEGFARANNLGIRQASGEYVVLLNNDVIVTRGWLGRLLRYLERDPQIGMVGPVTNFAGNEARIPVHYDTVAEMEEFAEQYALKHEGQAFEIEMLAMFCVAMRRPLLQTLGPLDEQFEIGMFEDDDYSQRVKMKGYKLVCAEDVFIHHFGMSAFKQLKRGQYRQLFESNRKKFERKWGMRWQPHRQRDDAARDREDDAPQ